jgi:hypothetical protein
MTWQVLALDITGAPRKWVSAETAVGYYARNMVAYEFGNVERIYRGGWQRNGHRSQIRVSNILAVHGPEFIAHDFAKAPSLTSEKLFARDRCLCAYCGVQYRERDLSRDHVTPSARGGRDTWMNLVTACRACNARKGSRTPEEAGMPLRYLPYVPSRWEDFILANRHILVDQMEYLLAKVPAHSRLHA